MNELAVRGVSVYCLFSVASFLMKEAMIGNGANLPKNPAWLLISSIYELFKWSWWLLLAGTAVALITVSIIEFTSHLSEQKRKREADARAVVERAREMKERVRQEGREKVQKRVEEKERQLKQQAEDAERERREKEHLESLKRRTPQEAVELALQDFCKGG